MSTTPAKSTSAHWWHTFFDNTYASYGLAATDPQLNEQIVDFLIKTLQLKPGNTVFDQCCGIGRLSLLLAKRGIKIIGVDLTATYIDRAKREAGPPSGNLSCEFHVGDAFEFRTPRPCDAAFNWFTSFGYSEDDETNIKMMQRAFESLKPGGRFIMDYLNVPGVFAALRPAMVNRPTVPGLEGLVVLQENKPDYAAGMMRSEWTEFHPDGRRATRPLATRMFMPHELVRMLLRCGFVEPQLFGWIDGEPLTHASRRCVVLVRKPT